MSKIDFRKIRNEYIRRSMRYADGVRLLYDNALADIAREFALVDYDPDAVFSFSEYGKFGRVDDIMCRLEEQIQAVIDAGIENEFAAAYKAHDNLLKQVLGSNITSELERAFAPRMASGNAAKLYTRETAYNNITRSIRVWNGATLGQMETAVQEALMEGMPAKQMAGLIKQYLNDPDSCFRRFRIKTGVDADGKSMYGRKWKKRVRNEDGSVSWFDADPRDYPTGQGVYHSSYKNALRYTRTTTNIAYRTADYERYQTEAFVLGIEIHITGNPEHVEDICDILQGRYPKEFKWTGWHPQCYSDDSEVYTKDGWKLFKDVNDDDLILSLNPQTRDLEFVPILLNISRPHKGKMVHFFNRSYSQLVTPEHDVLCVSKQDVRTFRRLKAEKCGKSQPIYRSSEWQGNKIESVAVGGLDVPFTLFAEFMGYWLSDGSIGHRWEVGIAQTDDDRSRIYDCIAKMGMKPRYNGGKIEFNSKDWYEYLQQFGKAADKYVPQVIKDSNADGIKVFLDAFVSCDGHTQKPKSFVGNRGSVCRPKEGGRIYFTSSKRMADDIGELILKTGRRPSYKVRKCAGTQHEFKNGTYTINYDHYIISECSSKYATQYYKEYVDYDGMVYDITLAKNHTLYIRHNGKCFWGSNCRCFQVPILATPDEVNAMADAIMNDQDPSTVPVAGRVTDVPDNFKRWVSENQDRIQETIDKGKQLPYFLRDNGTIGIDGSWYINGFVQYGTPQLSEREKRYIDLSRNRDYTDVAFNRVNGGLKATHIYHNFDKSKGWYERTVQDVGFTNGHSVVLESEIGKQIGERYTEGEWNGRLFEIGAAETATSNNIKSALNHCSSKPECKTAIVFFSTEDVDMSQIRRTLSRWFGLIRSGAKGAVDFEEIYFITPTRIVYSYHK